MLDKIMEVLTARRLMSLENLALSLEMEPEQLHPKLQQLDADGRIRYAQSKCSGSCSTCSTSCGSEDVKDEVKMDIDPTTIVISMELKSTSE